MITVMLIIGASALCFAEDESQEPSLTYTLDINGEQHEILLDQAFQIQGTFTDPQIVLMASPVRHFTYGGLAFQYPASFTWEAGIEADNDKQWTLSGNDFKIMYFILPDVLSAESFAQSMVNQFGIGNTQIGETERMLGDHSYQGKSLIVTFVGTRLNMEIFSMPAENGSRLLIFQDSPPDNGAVSEEGAKALDLLSKSYKDTMASK